MLPADIGLTDDQFVDVVTHAPRTRPDRYTIIEHLDLAPDGIHSRLTDYADALRDHLG